MPELFQSTATGWQQGADLLGGDVGQPWQEGVTLESQGGTYTPPPAPPGGTPTAPSTAARFSIAAPASRIIEHAVLVTDLRDGQPVQVDSLTISSDADSVFWALAVDAKASAYNKLRAGAQPASLRVSLDGQHWDFVVESVTRSRELPSQRARIQGRSLTCAASSPFEVERVWRIEGDTTAAQIAAMANLYTQLDVVWGVQDWPVPAGVFAHSGTPLGVVKRVAETIGAVVISDRAAYSVQVLPRYPLLPNEWATAVPDVEIALGAVRSESFERRSSPPYDGVYLFGQQQGAAAFVKRAGTSGANLHPVITDLLLTDDAACAQRGAAVLGAAGEKQDHRLVLPFVAGTGEPGAFEVNWLARVVEPGETWYGLVRGVSIQVSAQTETAPATIAQTVTLERHMEAIPGTVAAPALPPALLFTGPVPDQSVVAGAAFSLALAGFFSLGQPPYRYAMRSGELPAWVNFDRATGLLTGTAPGSSAPATPLQFRGIDSIDSTADTNVLQLTVTPPASPVSVGLWRFNGTNGQTSGIVNEGTAGGTVVNISLDRTPALSSSTPKFGATSLNVSGVGSFIGYAGVECEMSAAARPAAGQAFTIRGWMRMPATGGQGFFIWYFNGLNSLSGFSSFGMTIRATDTAGGTQVVGWSGGISSGGVTSTVNIGGTGSFARNTWGHVQISVDTAGDARLFVNSVQIGPTVNIAGRIVGTEPRLPKLVIEANSSGNLFIDDANLLLNYADVTDFTPPGAL